MFLHSFSHSWSVSLQTSYFFKAGQLLGLVTNKYFIASLYGTALVKQLGSNLHG